MSLLFLRAHAVLVFLIGMVMDPGDRTGLFIGNGKGHSISNGDFSKTIHMS